MEKEKLNDNLVLSAERGHLDRIRYLLKQGDDIDAQDENGQTALTESAWWGNLDCVNYLVGKRADIHVKDKEEKTALMWATNSGELDCLKYLVEQGADIHAQNNDGGFYVQCSLWPFSLCQVSSAKRS